ncbi:unnamed protein product [Clavelina lepadiformis]|uniref:Uncharacterized protein n=1 Tax=Clavelina lepadiformis TaxID=159417 RepID=A0ABP0GCR0_CLALP
MKTTSTPSPMGSSTLVNLLLAEITIHYLNLSGIKFGDAGVPFIMSCLDKIEKLYMTDCNITEEGVRVIIEHINNCSDLPKVLEFSYDKMNQLSVLRCGLDLLDNGNFRNVNLTPVGWEALATTINKLPEPMKKLNLRGNNLGDDGASHISFCLSKIEELDIRWCKISASGIKSISDAISKLPKPSDIADGNLGRQECETTRREFTERLAAVSDVSDCRPTSIRSTERSVRCEQLSSKVNLRAAEPPSRRPNASTKHDKAANPKTAERGKGKDIQQEAERQFLEANQAVQDSLRQKQQELYVAQEIARTMAQATASAASSVAECLEPSPLLQPSSPTASQSTTGLQGPTRFRVHFYNIYSKDRS